MRGHILEFIAALRAEHDVAAVGIGAAGLVDRDGVIRYAPNVPGFRNTPVRSEIEEAIGLPTIVENDANAAAWGELTHGAARGAERDDQCVVGTASRAVCELTPGGGVGVGLDDGRA